MQKFNDRMMEKNGHSIVSQQRKNVDSNKMINRQQKQANDEQKAIRIGI